MKVVVQFTAEEELEAIPIMLDRYPGIILRDRVYVLEEPVVAELRRAGVTFDVLSRESSMPDLQGAGAGERI